jgi:hypothetical protein
MIRYRVCLGVGLGGGSGLRDGQKSSWSNSEFLVEQDGKRTWGPS